MSWRLHRATETLTPVPVIRLAQVVCSPGSTRDADRGVIVVELLDAGARLTINVGVDRETLATLVDVVGARARPRRSSPADTWTVSPPT